MHKWRPGNPRPCRLQQIFFLALLSALILTTAACTALWGPRVSPPTLTLRQPVQIGTHWEAVLSVSDMPDGGVVGICITNGGITISRATPDTARAEGLNGFIITAQDLAAPAPEGTLLAVGPSTPLADGKLLKISFQTSDASPSITLDPSKVSLSSAAGTWIAEWELHSISSGSSK